MEIIVVGQILAFLFAGFAGLAVFQ